MLRTPLDRLMDLVYQDPNSGCWIFFGRAYQRGGYGAFWWPEKATSADGCVKAHRASYFLFRREIPPQIIVRHKCDTPCCVNPDHLEEGDRLDNARDMAKRGRGRKGSLPRGVQRKTNTFHAYYGSRGKTIYVGAFRTAEEAGVAADEARRQHWERAL